MSELDRRTFLKRIGQGTAVIGMGGLAAGKSWPQKTGVAQAATKADAKGKYQIFYPGQYYDWEKEMIEERVKLEKNGPPKSGSYNSGHEVGNNAVTEDEIIAFNSKWDPYNPLFNDKAYARKAGYPSVPALPTFRTPVEGNGVLKIPKTLPDIWLFAHGPNDIEYFRHIVAGDSFTSKTQKLYFVELTEAGSTLRHFKLGATVEMYDKNGKMVSRSNDWVRNGYKKIIDGSPKPSFSEISSRTVETLKPGHYTTDEEWEYIKELWKKEEIRGSQKLYWEDVNIGDEPPWICSNPISYMDMVGWYGGTRIDPRESILKGDLDTVFRDRFGNYLFGVPGMVGGRNIIGARAVLYNDTSAKQVTRLVTNWIGDAGLVTRIGWMFQQSYAEMRYPREGGEYLDEVPYMKGKACTDHPSEGDTIIGKGYVTDKYKNDAGEGIIDIVCWAETLDDRIIEVVPVSARLPLKKG